MVELLWEHLREGLRRLGCRCGAKCGWVARTLFMMERAADGLFVRRGEWCLAGGGGGGRVAGEVSGVCGVVWCAGRMEGMVGGYECVGGHGRGRTHPVCRGRRGS